MGGNRIRPGVAADKRRTVHEIRSSPTHVREIKDQLSLERSEKAMAEIRAGFQPEVNQACKHEHYGQCTVRKIHNPGSVTIELSNGKQIKVSPTTLKPAG